MQSKFAIDHHPTPLLTTIHRALIPLCIPYSCFLGVEERGLLSRRCCRKYPMYTNTICTICSHHTYLSGNHGELIAGVVCMRTCTCARIGGAAVWLQLVNAPPRTVSTKPKSSRHCGRTILSNIVFKLVHPWPVRLSLPIPNDPIRSFHD